MYGIAGNSKELPDVTRGHAEVIIKAFALFPEAKSRAIILVRALIWTAMPNLGIADRRSTFYHANIGIRCLFISIGLAESP